MKEVSRIFLTKRRIQGSHFRNVPTDSPRSGGISLGIRRVHFGNRRFTGYGKVWLSESTASQAFSDFRNVVAFWKVPRPRTFVLVRATRWWSVWSIGGMMLTRKNRSKRGKIWPSVALFTTYLTWTDLGSTRYLRSDRPATSRLTHGAASVGEIYPNYT